MAAFIARSDASGGCGVESSVRDQAISKNEGQCQVTSMVAAQASERSKNNGKQARAGVDNYIKGRHNNSTYGVGTWPDHRGVAFDEDSFVPNHRSALPELGVDSSAECMITGDVVRTNPAVLVDLNNEVTGDELLVLTNDEGI